MGVVIRTRLSF